MDLSKEKDTAGWGGKGGEEDDDDEKRERKVRRDNEEGREREELRMERMWERQSRKGKGSLKQRGGAGTNEMENG